MKIQKPNGDKIKFLIPEVLAQIDTQAEPTVENIGAVGVAKDIIQGGGVLASLWDGRPEFRPELGTDLLRGPDSDFSEDTGHWSSGTGVGISAGALNLLKVSGDVSSSIDVPLAAGDYEVVYTTVIATGDIEFRVVVGNTNGITRTAPTGTFTETITAGAGDTIKFETVAGTIGKAVGITSVTVRHVDTWRVDTALDRRPRRGLDFALLATHNLLDVYESALQEVVDFYSNTSDSLLADPIAASRYLSGLLGKGAPFLSFAGPGSTDYVTIANDPNLNFTTQMSISCRARHNGTVLAAEEAMCGKYTPAGNQRDYLLGIAADNKLKARFVPGISGIEQDSDLALSTIDEWHNYDVTFDSESGAILYVDGLEIDSTESGTLLPLVPSTGPFRVGDRGDGTALWNGDVKDTFLYNRIRAPKEIAQGALNVPVPKPLIIGDNSSFNTLGDWVSSNGTIEIDAGLLKVSSTAENGGGRFTVVSTPGNRMKWELDYKNTAADVARYFIYDNTNSAFIIPVTDLADNTSLTSIAAVNFTVPTGCVEILIGLGGEKNGDVVWFDNPYLTDLDTLVTFPLVVDQFGDQTNLVTNGDFAAWTGDNPDDWTVTGEVAADPECSEVGIGEGHGGAGTGACNLFNTVDLIFIEQQITGLVAGASYGIEIELGAVDITGEGLKIHSTTNDFSVTLDAADGGSRGVTINFEAIGTSLFFQIFALEGGANWTFDNVKIYKIGCVAAYQPPGISVSQGYG